MPDCGIPTFPMKLRAEAAFKLGWCYVETKEPDKAIEAFGYFLQAFPDNPQVPSALAQRALAYQEDKQYDRARRDLDQLLANYPKARASAKPRCNKRLSSSDSSTTARAWPRLSSNC